MEKRAKIISEALISFIEAPFKRASRRALSAWVSGRKLARPCNHSGNILTGYNVPANNQDKLFKNHIIGSPRL